MRAATGTLDRRTLPMDADPTQTLVAKLRELPPERIAEVEDFVDFLKTRAEQAQRTAARRLGAAMARLDALNLPPMSAQEVQAEIKAARALRHSTADADRR